MALDERLKHELERAGRPADPSGVYEHLIRRRERRRIARKIQVTALAVVVVLGSIGGFAALTRVFRGSQTPPVVADVELGFPACDVTRVDGTFFPTGEIATAFVFEPEPEGGCDGPNENFQYIAIVARDGSVVARSEELTAGTDAFGFRVVAAPDIDGDGIAELAIDVSDPETPALGIEFYRVQIGEETQGPVGFVHLAPNCDNEGCLTPQLAGIGTFTWGVSERAFSGIDCGGVSLVAWTESNTGADDGLYVLWDVQKDGLVERSDVVIDHEPHTEPPTDMCGAPVNLGAATTAPTPTPSPEPSQPSNERDIGLGFPVCDVTSVRGEFGLGVTGTAYVATRTGDTDCPKLGDGMQVLAVDVSGDGLADTSYGPLRCDDWCNAFAAPDVDGDGTDELLVQNIQFSVVGLRLFDVIESHDGPQIVLPIIEPPGDPEMAFQGFDGSKEPQFWIGGDGFGADALRCELAGDGRVLISSAAQMVPPDRQDSVWQVHETTFVLQGDVLRVIGTRDYEEPAFTGSGPTFTRTTGCGADLDPYD